MINVEKYEVDCHFPNVEDASPAQIDAAEKWWMEVGQHSQYIHAVLTDTRFKGEMFITKAQSPYYRKDDADAKKRAGEMLDSLVEEAIRLRIEQHPEPQTIL